MLFKKKSTLSLILVCILSIVIISIPGCSDKNEPTAVNYKTYEMKADDVRLKYLNHPLFSFEYPAIFNLIDLNLDLPSMGMAGPSGVSNTDFIAQQKDLDEPWLRVRNEEPISVGLDYDYHDASSKFEYVVSIANEIGDNITTKKVTVFGIAADYVEFSQPGRPIITDKEIKETRMSVRSVVFEYSGFIWEILMNWTYHGSEPPEVKGYFNHVIETFKILDTKP